MKYKICVPIPVKSSDIRELKKLINQTLRYNPNLIEFRLDYINDIKSITPFFLNELKSTVQSNIPVIFTFRDHKEGGITKIDGRKHLEILKMLILSQPNYLDIEMRIEKNFLTDIINLAYQNKVKLIFSYHDFDKTPSFEIATSQIQNFMNQLSAIFGLESPKVERFTLKMIYTAESFEDNLIPLKLCKDLTKKNIQIISFCMGKLGIFSRVLCVLNGSSFTYASIIEETAPGQINIENLRTALKIIKPNS